MKRFSLYLFISLFTFLSACRDDDEKNANQLPDTSFSVEEINLSGDKRLNSIVRLSWYGVDPDGYIKGYEISLDGQNWFYTTIQDSTFRFSISEGSDTSDVSVYVRSIDNENAVDPTPDYLRIPIRNTPPVASFDEDLTISDTVKLVATTQWAATDIDGDETITQVLISLNGKKWFELNKSKPVFSIVPVDPEATDTTDAYIYYESESTPVSERIEGLVLNDTNKIYIKAVDQAGVESSLDTSNTFFMKGKEGEILVVAGVGGDAKDIYQNALNQINVSYDYLDLLSNNGLYRPKLWNITFRLQLSFYSKLFFFSDETTYLNPYTNVSSLLLEFAASSLQSYANSGGKYFISTEFIYSTDISGFRGVLPIDSLPTNNTRSLRLFRDSAIVSPLAPNFPDLSPTNAFKTRIGVFKIDPNDSEVLYTAQVFGNWNDTKIIASGRRQNGKLNQVFFAIELWELNNDPPSLINLFDQIFNVEFN
jgi:hypothetical protein